MVEEVAKRINCDIEWREMPFGASLDALKVHAVDIVTNVHFKTAERERFSRFSINLGNFRSHVYFLQSSTDTRDIKSLADLSGRRVGFRKGVSYFAEFEKLQKLNRIPFADNETMASSFATREIDVMVVNNKISSEKALKSAGVNSTRYRYASLDMDKEIVGTYLMYSLKPELANVFTKFDIELGKMLKDGVIADIYKSFDAEPLLPVGDIIAHSKK